MFLNLKTENGDSELQITNQPVKQVPIMKSSIPKCLLAERFSTIFWTYCLFFNDRTSWKKSRV